ncbi:uncharacterized protein JN550_002543 [Neoarthrinium moseri]|uniref:uncharacterized protein n=1 Tax=Neoarthrinium moseri TaxID=1658444 RepID=UPI001FDAE4FB|nr:uncharacterized protein JN550_002543 [Neoarthrinium moseri]KAI1875114.1 hypothetical protein JN550_002543 [Neoarthrinium moseri]
MQSPEEVAGILSSGQHVTNPWASPNLKAAPHGCIALVGPEIYAQPLLIRETIRYVVSTNSGDEPLTSFNIIALSLVIYTGLAISTAAYQNRLNRLSVMTRGVLVSLVHDKALKSSNDTLNAGKVVTLMSNDVDSLTDVAGMFHETWAQIIEVAIGVVLLAREVGWLWPLPLVFIFLCSRMSQFVARNLRGRQAAWNNATQNRISMTSNVLSTIKNVKMLGLQVNIVSYIERLRQIEINTMARRVRWMMVAYNASANALGIFTPIITLVLYAVLARLKGVSLDAETAFTTTAILGMVTHPANMVMTIIPRAVASFSSFDRIQTFLLEAPQIDLRKRPQGHRINGSVDSQAPNPSDHIAVSLTGVSVKMSRTILQDISFEMPQGAIFMCAGPTASGKTSIAKAILGELQASDGTVIINNRRIGYCAQSPWLPSTTIKRAVQTFSITDQEDEIWYKEVLGACCLEFDLKNMACGDETLVGSRGMNLSGGQRQRVVSWKFISGFDQLLTSPEALARALYSRCKMLVLDDTLSGLDAKTENQVVENLLGTNGLVRRLGITVFLTTNGGSATSSSSGPSSDNGGLPDQRTRQEPRVQPKGSPDAALVKRREGDSELYGFYAAGLVLISFVAWSTTNGIMWSTVMRVAPHSGLVLHSRLLSTVLSAPLSYFSKTDSGEILNRFSQDIQLVDKQVGNAISTLCVQVFKLSVQAALLFMASKYMTFSLPICAIVVYIIQNVYLRTSRQLRLLELESRSAVFTNFLEAVEGVTTIRAFQSLDQAKEDHISYLEFSQKPFYFLFCLQRWLNIVLDMLVAAVAVGVISLAVILKGTTTGGQIGLALNMVLVANTTLLRLVQSWTNLEISLGAISRLKTLQETVSSEDQYSDAAEAFLDNPWPEPGVVELNGITASYNPEAVALHEFSLKAEAGQLIVLCGRTGRGKSSVLLCLLKMMDVKGGSIRVHGLDLTHAPTRVIREHFFVTIPQDAVLLNQATLRFNVDPSETISSTTVVHTLKMVQLWQHFVQPNASAADGVVSNDNAGSGLHHHTLDEPLSSLPSLSAGQTQLLALARAILQVHCRTESGYQPIILLDEATSSLDATTEKLMLSIIRREFCDKGLTTIMVAHRLGAVSEIMRDGIDKMVDT